MCFGEKIVWIFEILVEFFVLYMFLVLFSVEVVVCVVVLKNLFIFV